MKNNFKHKNGKLKIKYKTDFTRPILNENFEERKWEEVEKEDPDFNFYWASVKTIKTKVFNPHYKFRLRNNQMVNHFPNHLELTRKDLLIKNFKRFFPKLPKKAKLVNNTQIDLTKKVIPSSYILPSEYSLFLEDFQKSEEKKWIFKPAGSAQGLGIKIITKLSQAKNLSTLIKNSKKLHSSIKEKFVICKYLDNPLLINSRKFDLRTYVLVTNYNPLTIWRHKAGFARVCFEDYTKIRKKSCDPNKDLHGHLTNVSFQKYSEKYNDKHGGKWPISSLFFYIERNFGKKILDKLKKDIDEVYVISLKTVQNCINNDFHCFELYGFDILIDNKFRPWLIEVNASPSLLNTTKNDYMMKKHVLNDLINVVFPPDWAKSKRKGVACRRGKDVKVGGFEKIFDESEGDGEKKSLRQLIYNNRFKKRY